jgi:spore maturation protein CgeB
MNQATHPLNIVIFGLSITSSWGNGHATTYRSLVTGLARRGHHVAFYERRRSWYAANRDLGHNNVCDIVLYESIAELEALFPARIDADVVMIGSFVPEGVRLAQWVLARTDAVVAFYDIDTPVTLAALERAESEYLTPALIPEFDLYLSFSGGQVLDILRNRYGAQRVHAFFCSVDPKEYFPLPLVPKYDLGYLGTYSVDRQPKLDELLCRTAREWPRGKFIVAGAQYPATINWPNNVVRVDHVPPHLHARFYNSQRFTLNVTREDMVASGFAPSVRLFEAAACGVPVLSDPWPGLDELFRPGEEILLVRNTRDVSRSLRQVSPEEARTIGARARARVLCAHTSEHRAQELEQHVAAVRPIPAAALEHVPLNAPTGTTFH